MLYLNISTCEEKAILVRNLKQISLARISAHMDRNHFLKNFSKFHFLIPKILTLLL